MSRRLGTQPGKIGKILTRQPQHEPWEMMIGKIIDGMAVARKPWPTINRPEGLTITKVRIFSAAGLH